VPVLTPSVTDRLLVMYGILPRQHFFVVAVVYSESWDFSGKMLMPMHLSWSEVLTFHWLSLLGV